jgi:hypothetical protein
LELLVNLEYVVVLTIAAPRGVRPKEYVPVAPGLTWHYMRHEFCSDGWLEYVVEAVLDQEQMDAVARETWMNIDDHDSGGIYKPGAFPKHLTPASVWFGEAWWDNTAYRFYICPFPSGLRNHDAHRFSKFDHHTAWMAHRYQYERFHEKAIA